MNIAGIILQQDHYQIYQINLNKHPLSVIKSNLRYLHRC